MDGGIESYRKFDEALEVISLNRGAIPDDTDLKGFEDYLLREKMNQDELFSTDPGSDVDMSPIG